MKQKDNDVVKGLRRAERELQFVRNGYDHPWVEMNRIHKNKKAYDRKKDRKSFDYDSFGLYFFNVDYDNLTSFRLSTFLFIMSSRHTKRF
jgi:hypothetical protein